jgi:Xaa-Pro aminopeptidase
LTSSAAACKRFDPEVLAMDHFAPRRERLKQALADEGLDALAVSSVVNVSYLTGFSGDSSVLVLTRDRALLVSDPRYTALIAEECPGLPTHIRPPAQKIHEAVAEVLTKLGCRGVGFESAAVTVAELEALKGLTPAIDWKGGSDRVERLRTIKDASEVAAIREAIAIVERAFTVLRALLRPEDREKELADAMEGYVRRAGGLGSAFPPIIEVGERAALPHAPPGDRAVSTGELLLVDCGASGRFYKSDLTRVWATHKISAKLEEVYTVVLKAQQQAMRAVRPGAVAKDIDAEARGVIAAAGFGDFFGHGLGHGIGLQVHEGPAVRPLSETVLRPGMVFTIEPGIYLPGWGGVRIEDDVLVTEDGCEVLSHLPRDLDSIRVFA